MVDERGPSLVGSLQHLSESLAQPQKTTCRTRPGRYKLKRRKITSRSRFLFRLLDSLRVRVKRDREFR